VYDKLLGRFANALQGKLILMISFKREIIFLCRVPNPICMIIRGFYRRQRSKKKRDLFKPSSDPYNLHAFNLIRTQKTPISPSSNRTPPLLIISGVLFCGTLCAQHRGTGTSEGFGLGHRYAVK
jgi:hypothetical protein